MDQIWSDTFFAYKVLLEHRDTHLFMHYLWLFSYGPKSHMIVTIWSFTKNFVYHPDLIEGLEIVLICYVHNIQTYSLFFSSVMFTLSVIQENEV